MASLLFDGDVQRVYEVPDSSSFVVDGGGYRIYTPDTPNTDPTSFTAIELWTAWVDYHDANKWASLCFDRSGGAFRETTSVGDVYAVTEIRFINDWHFVPANYFHVVTLDGNVLPNLNTGQHSDYTRVTDIPPPQVKVQFADRGQFTQVNSGSGISASELDARDRRLIGHIWASS